MSSLSHAIAERYPAFRHTLYRRYWLASLASVGATQLITLGQGWLIYELTQSVQYLGYLGVAAAAPNIAVTLFGGVIADRLDKRQILRTTSMIITLLLALLAWLDFSERVEAWHVLTIAALFSTTTGFDWPTRVAIFPHLVDRAAMMSAVAMNSFVWQVTRMAVPALGGVLMYLGGTWIIFAIAAAGFLIMFVVISGIHVTVPQPSTDGALTQLKRGIQYIFDNELFKWLIALTFVCMLFGQSYVQILPAFIDAMGRGEQSFGYLLSAGGIGSIVGTLAIGGMSHERELSRIMFGGGAGSVVTLWLFVLCVDQGWFAGALLAVFTMSGLSSLFIVTSMSYLQLKVPDELRGRVMGIHSMGYSMVPLGGMILGTLNFYVSPGIAVVLATSVFLLALGAAWSAKPSLRRLSHA